MMTKIRGLRDNVTFVNLKIFVIPFFAKQKGTVGFT